MGVWGSAGHYLVAVLCAMLAYIATRTDWAGVGGEAAQVCLHPSLSAPCVLRYLAPRGIAWAGMAAVGSAMMSSIDSAVLSAASLFVWNVLWRACGWGELRTALDQRRAAAASCVPENQGDYGSDGRRHAPTPQFRSLPPYLQVPRRTPPPPPELPPSPLSLSPPSPPQPSPPSPRLGAPLKGSPLKKSRNLKPPPSLPGHVAPEWYGQPDREDEISRVQMAAALKWANRLSMILIAALGGLLAWSNPEVSRLVLLLDDLTATLVAAPLLCVVSSSSLSLLPPFPSIPPLALCDKFSLSLSLLPPPPSLSFFRV